MKKEIWKSIPNIDNYLVSSQLMKQYKLKKLEI
jgi:hypothetical protein